MKSQACDRVSPENKRKRCEVRVLLQDQNQRHGASHVTNL